MDARDAQRRHAVGRRNRPARRCLTERTQAWTTDDDLPGDGVAGVATGDSGDVWIVSRYGPDPTGRPDVEADLHLLRFDGDGWAGPEGFDADLPAEAEDVIALAECGDGTTVWAVLRLATGPGGRSERRVARLDDHGWTVATSEDGLPHAEAASLAVDDERGVWIATAEGLARYDDPGWTGYTTGRRATGRRPHRLGGPRRGRLGVGGNCRGRVAVRRPRVVHADGRRRPRSRGGLAIAAGGDGTVWVPLAQSAARPEGDVSPQPGGIARFDGEQWVDHTAADDPLDLSATDLLARDSVTALHVDDDGGLWAGTRQALARYDGWEWTTWADAPVSGVQTIAVGDDTVWVGSQHGLARFEDR